MKQWTVTYREKSGLKTSVVIEAEDRAGVFAELKQRGINAISITEGAVKAKRSVTSILHSSSKYIPSLSHLFCLFLISSSSICLSIFFVGFNVLV